MTAPGFCTCKRDFPQRRTFHPAPGASWHYLCDKPVLEFALAAYELPPHHWTAIPLDGGPRVEGYGPVKFASTEPASSLELCADCGHRLGTECGCSCAGPGTCGPQPLHQWRPIGTGWA